MEQRMQKALRASLSALVAAVVAFGMAFSGMAAARPAFAETDNIEAELTDEQRRVEETAAAYNEAEARAAELDCQIAENEERIAEIEDALPGRQRGAADAVRELYFLQRDSVGLIEMLLGSESLGEFLMRYQYLTRAHESNVAVLEELEAMKAELEQTRVELSEARAQVDEERAAARIALAEAQAAREQAQREAEERAAAERAALEAAATQEGRNDAPSDDSAQSEEGLSDAADEAGDAAGADEGTSVSPPTSDGADWTSDKATFVSQWAARIDAYLADSPLAGQGETFAAAAWDYGVDPRFSPAISAVESTKGAYCFYPHNAWGWGSVSWDSWEEAIYDHVAGLARGYGYTISVEGAQKYCPPNWQHWYNSVSANMSMI